MINGKLASQNYISYPLNNGDFWQYHEYYLLSGYYSVEVIGDTVFSSNGKTYKILQNISGGPKSYHRFFDDKVYYFDPTLQIEKLKYDFTLSVGDTVAIFPNENDTLVVTIVYIGYKNIFGSLRKQWHFLYDWVSFIDDEVYYTITDNIGLTNTTNIWYRDSLNAAIINGISYGTVVSLDYKNVQYPKELNLSNNYPNPFNPSTKISWQLPVGSWQTLKIYDVLGNEVATLVDEYKPAGSYEVEWDASVFPSGIYFYQLKTEGFVETKKMILLK